MDSGTRKALEAIDLVCQTPTPTGPVDLDEEYLRNVKRVEGLPCNRSGEDKSWIRELLKESDVHWSRAVRREASTSECDET